MGMAARMIQATFIRPSRDESKGLVNRQNRSVIIHSHMYYYDYLDKKLRPVVGCCGGLGAGRE